MNNFTRNAIRKTFWFLCIVCAVALTVWCVQRFHSDEDLSQIEFKKFHDLPGSFYPSITICFTNPFLDHKLRQHDPNLTAQAYEDFLRGRQDAVELIGTSSVIDYDDVAIKLKDHLEKVHIVMLNKDTATWNGTGTLVNSSNQKEYEEHQNMNIYVSARLSNSKCYTVDIPFMPNRRIYVVHMQVAGDIFPNGIRPAVEEFQTYVHNRKQFMRSRLISNVNWESNINKTMCYIYKAYAGSIEVMQRRDKSKAPCNKNLEQLDDMAWERIADNVGCVPRHWKITTSKQLPVCSTQQQHKDINSLEYDYEEQIPPCRSIDRITTPFMEESCSNQYNKLILRFYFKEVFFKQIEIVKAYNFDSFIGNAGRYKNMVRCTSALLMCLSMTVLQYTVIYTCLFFRRLHWPVSWLHTCTIARSSVSACGSN